MRKMLLLTLLSWAALTLHSQSNDGPPYHIFSIYFGGGSWYIDDSQAMDLSNWLDSIEGLENHEISVHGHTDDIGGIEYNQWLSRMRTDAALKELMKKGISRDVISIEDFGELNPIYDNSTWEGKLKNRRVDVIIRPLVL